MNEDGFTLKCNPMSHHHRERATTIALFLKFYEGLGSHLPRSLETCRLIPIQSEGGELRDSEPSGRGR